MMGFEGFEALVRSFFPETDTRKMEQFKKMEDIYREWNAKINVISRKDMDSFYDHHVLHSLALARYFSLLGEDYSGTVPHTVLDLGTGGGFPGIPLAIMYPSWHFTLCDSIGKKTLVAKETAAALGLENAEIVCSRAEELEGEFDLTVSRAVATLDRLYQWAWNKTKTSLFCLKGGDINSEISDFLRISHIEARHVRVWEPDCFPNDDYFAEKFVIQIEKNYICSPKTAKYKK